MKEFENLKMADAKKGGASYEASALAFGFGIAGMAVLAMLLLTGII